MKSLEEVPGSEDYIINTGVKQWVDYSAHPGDWFAIEFVIPSTNINVINQVGLFLTSFCTVGYDEHHGVGLSRVMTSDETLWETPRYNFCCSYEWVTINNIKLKDGGPVRIAPDETWYMIVKVESWSGCNPWFRWGEALNNYITTYHNGVEITDLSFFVKGYVDETFFVDFSYIPSNPVVDEIVVFTDTSNQNLLESREWFIDGVSMGSNPSISYVFTELRTYSVSLVGISYGGSNLQMNKLIEIGEQPPPDFELPWWVIAGIIVAGGIGVIAYLKKEKKK